MEAGKVPKSSTLSVVDTPAISQPEYEIFNILHGDGSPDIVSVTPIHRGGQSYDEDEIFERIASDLQSAVIDAITKFNPYFSPSNFGHINGILQMNNLNDYRHAHTEDVNLAGFGVKDVLAIFERVVGYGEISIFDVSFSFWINPLSLKEGSPVNI